MSADIDEVREAVLDTAKTMLERGLVSGTSGNVSARVDQQRVCITPSSVPYETMTLDDLVVIDMAGEVVEAVRDDRHPSSEKALHTKVYERYQEIESVIHTHPVHATMFAVTRQPIPPIVDEFTMYVGGEVPVCTYAPSGTDELAEHARDNLQHVGAALLANHGMVAAGPSLSRALHISALVERSAQILWGARSLGKLHPLPDEVNDDFRNVYGLLRTMP